MGGACHVSLSPLIFQPARGQKGGPSILKLEEEALARVGGAVAEHHGKGISYGQGLKAVDPTL